jgi:hypothetical protein
MYRRNDVFGQPSDPLEADQRLSEREGALAQRGRHSGPRGGQGDHRDEGDREHERRRADERELWDDPEEHHRIENHRFAGGLAPTPDRYALAREQWSRLPGAVVRPSMNPAVGAPAPDAPQPSDHPGGKGPDR